VLAILVEVPSSTLLHASPERSSTPERGRQARAVRATASTARKRGNLGRQKKKKKPCQSLGAECCAACRRATHHHPPRGRRRRQGRMRAAPFRAETPACLPAPLLLHACLATAHPRVSSLPA
jgi:hypothetical protein